MSNWHSFGKSSDQAKGGETSTPNPTMNLRLVYRKDGGTSIEQLIEYRNSNGLVVDTEWVAIPVIYE